MEFGNGNAISLHTLPGMWLSIAAGIQVDFGKRGSQRSGWKVYFSYKETLFCNLQGIKLSVKS